MSIQLLPADVIAQIKSSTTITSLNGVLCELVKNSLDAEATKIDVSVDYAKGGCVIEDNGLGIPPSEFREDAGLGKLYHSSKLNSQTQVHGGCGTFLASLSAMALLTVTSHHHLYHSHNTINMHKSEVVSRQTPTPAHQHLQYTDHGTRITVRDLFGNMPVRVKQRAIVAGKQRGNDKNWEDLRRIVVLLLLAWHCDVAITLREAGTMQKMVIRLPLNTHGIEVSTSGLNISKVCTVLSQASLITPGEKAAWVAVSASAEKIQIHGTVSLDPSPNKYVQFISFGIQPVLSVEGQSILHNEVNRLFLNSAFGNEEEGGVDEAEKSRRLNDARYKFDGYTHKELKGGKRRVERWPKFYINIQQMYGSKNITPDVDGVLDFKGRCLGTILELLQTMIWEFLTRYHFRPGHKRGKRSNKSHISQSPEKTNQPVTPGSSKFDGFHETLRPASVPLLCETDRSKRRKPESDLQPRYDPMGLNVKLPLFQRSSSQLESPFNSWSKVKRGTPKIVSSKTPLEEPSQYDQASKLASVSPNIGFLNKDLKEGGTKPLISFRGKILSRPFADAEVHLPPTKTTVPQLPEKTSVAVQKNSHGDEVVEWTNPTTKVKSLVNQRTGHTVATNRYSLENERSHTLNIVQSPAFSRDGLTRGASTRSNAPSPFVSNILKDWENPVFAPAELPIPSVSIDGLDDATRNILNGHQHICSRIDINRAFKDTSSRIKRRVSKDGLRNAEVISQVDNKFIFVKVRADESFRDDTMLVIIDQHAADERVRIESLMEEFCTPSIDAESGVLSMSLNEPIVFEVPEKEIQLLRIHQTRFSNWGILYDLTNDELPARHKDKSKPVQRVSIRSLPPLITARCKSDPRLLIDIIRTEVWKCSENPVPQIASISSTSPLNPKQTSWLQRIHNCPQGIIDMLNSRACRSSIMFNDVLTKEQCQILVGKLADCRFPYQCAHGRPSLVPVVELHGVLGKANHTDLERGSDGQREAGFGMAVGRWREGMREG